jgi:glycosyltransferase involved in cell wall biosynthesis
LSCRILYLVGQLSLGGQERQLYYLLQAVNKEYYRPAVVVWNFKEGDVYVSRIRDLGVPLYHIPVRLHPTAKLVELRHLVINLGAELVHSYSFYTNFAAWWGTLGTCAIPVGSVRNSFFFQKSQVGFVLGRLSARWPRHQICNSRSAAKEARRSSKLFAPEQLYVVYNGIDLHKFRLRPILDGSQTRIVGIGRHFPEKRWDLLVAAAKQLKGLGFSFSVKIVGDGPLRRSLAQQIHQAGLDDCVELLSYVEDIPGLLAESSFLVHTADFEGCPNAVMEAMAVGRAVVATDAGDIPYIVDNGATGFIVKRGDQQGLAEGMAKLITHSELCRRMGEAGRIKAEMEFQPARLVEETLAAYRAAGWRDS